MLRRLYGQLPNYARPDHPVMRYLLLRDGRRTTRGRQIFRLALFIGLIVGLPLVGWLIATRLGSSPIETQNRFDAIYHILYFPLVGLQVLLRVVAMSTTIGLIATEERQQTWDTLKITTDGAMLTMKARWATVFYRLAAFLAIVTAVRVLFVGIALYDLTTFQGRYVDLLLSGTVPLGGLSREAAQSTGVPIGVVIISLGMTAALLAPFTAVAFDAAFGMLIGTFARGKMSGTLGQFGLVLLRILITGAALLVGATALGLSPISAMTGGLSETSQPILGWLSIFFALGEGDLGLTALHLPYVGRMWSDYEYGVFIGAAFLGWVLLQALFANLFVIWAARRATRADRI
ncbi:MAG: hypothetical protein OHK0023_17560 [Anaerolineae bacterium]